MKTANDIAIKNGANELLFENGDFVVEPSDDQHVAHIVISSKGSWIVSPLTGIGIYNYLNAPLNSFVLRDLRLKIMRQLDFDGLKTLRLDIQSLDHIHIQAERKPFA